MAHKLNCPHCGLMLKEEGDDSKKARGQYRVYQGGKFKYIALKCLSCNKFFESWEP